MMSATMGYYSGVHAASIQAVAKYYGTSEIALILVVSFFLLGFALGPLLFALLSEMLGRNLIIRVTFGLFVISNIGCALAPNIETLLFFRFLDGILGAPTVKNAAGSLTNMWAPHQRAVPLALFTIASFLGFVIGPICGGPITQYASWHWGYWTTMILGGTTYLCALLFLPETYAPELIRQKQKKAGFNPDDDVKWKQRARDNLVRPWIMLFTAPVPAVVPILAGVPLGIGILTAFLDIAAYLTDSYGVYGASALAANGLLCRLFGAAFPLFSKRLYKNLGVPWGTSLLAFMATIMAPIPWIFYRYGPAIRKKNAYHEAAVAHT